MKLGWRLSNALKPASLQAIWVSAWTAGRQLGVHKRTVIRWCEKNRLEFIRTAGGHYRVSVASVRALRARANVTNADERA